MLQSVAATLSCALTGTQDPPPSRSGIVLFKLPAKWQRTEKADVSLLRPVDPEAKSYEIRIRPAVEAKGTLADALTEDANVLGKKYRVRPGSDPLTFRHPGGFDLGLRAFMLDELTEDGNFTAFTYCAYVYVLQLGKKSAAVEFFANDPNLLENNRQEISAFIEGCRLAHAEILVPGDPPLTLYDIEESLDFLQWLVDVPFTRDQRDVFRASIVDDWRKKDQETIQSVAHIFQLRAELAKQSPDQQDLVRKEMEPQVVAGLRKETDPASKLLLEIYDSARKPIAAGDPPLTRQQADAALELFFFMAAQLEGVEVRPTPADKDAWAKHLAASWEKLDANVRKTFAAMPTAWSATRAGWSELPEPEKTQIKSQFARLDCIKEMRSAFAKVKSDAGADAGALLSKMNQKYQMTSMLLKTGFDSTMQQMANLRNWGESMRMEGPRNHWSYRPR